MRLLVTALACLFTVHVVGQQTYVPDNWFEAYLENNGMGNGIQYDDSVFTSAIDTVIYLDLSYGAGQAIGVFDLTGIEDFTNLEYLDISYNLLTSIDLIQNTALSELYCNNNQLSSLELSQNTALIGLDCSYNLLTSLDLRNGNNTNMTTFLAFYNPNLNCINVDNSSWSTSNWSNYVDFIAYFSNDCSGTAIEEHIPNKEILRTIDVSGRTKNGTKNELLFHIYDDGSVEKKFVVE